MNDQQQRINSPKPGFSTPIKSPQQTNSPTISRYGRSHKPKIQDDYVSTDKKVSAYLKLSPGNQMQYFNVHKEQKKKPSPKKVDGNLVAEGSPKKRGRPPKTPVMNTGEGENILKIAIKAQPQDPSSPVDGCEWMVGDLAWARVGGHPFWPCVITLDPVQKIFTKIIRKGRNGATQRWMHVQFFGDNGRRSWLNTTAIMSYGGRDAFLQLGDTILAGMRRKDPKQTSAFVIKPAVVQVWEKAVQEAEDVVNATREERIAFFTKNFPPLPEPQLTRAELIEKVMDQSEELAKKRGRKRKAEPSPSEEDIKKKQIKLEETTPLESEPVDPLLTSTPRTIADRKKRQALLMQLARSNQPPPSSTPATTPTTETAISPVKPETETPPPPKQPPLKRPAVTETPVSVVEKKKPKKKAVKKKLAADFQAFSSKHFDRVSDDHPELNEKEIKKYLQKMWNEMDETQKARYRNRLTGQEKEESESSGEASEEVEGSSEDVDEEVRSSKSSSPAPLAVATQKSTTTKRNNCKYLFSGAKSEKVCQICELTGDTVRCRGPCQGYYHPACLINPPTLLVTPSGKKGRKGKSIKSLDGSPSSSDVSQIEEVVENGRLTIKNEVKVNEDKVEQNGFVEKGETEDSIVDVTEPEGKTPGKVRKGSKDSESGEEGEGFRCKDCQEGRSQPCFVCHEYVQQKTEDAKLYRCITAYCGKVYHEECLKPWPQCSWRSNGNGKSCERGVVTCPQHTCHTCASDNPSVIKARYSNDKLVRCVRCPTTYHYGNYCLPAGSEILTNTQIICPQHYQPPKKGIHHVNAAWCFICASGGSLICCDLCPTAFHAACLNITTPPGSYVCEDCLTGRFPLYGEIVWVKCGVYRWWPAEILYPALIPDNILNLPHVLGEFAVRFFGSHDHYWVNRGRVFLYQDGDTAGKGNYKKSSVDHMFERAVREASEAQRKYLEEKATRDAETRPGMKPPNYVKLKANKPVGNVRTLEMNVSSLTPCECDPTKEAPCAPESDCLNRILMVECNPLVCPAGEKCCNQLFEKRQYPPLQPYQTQARGWGLKTLVPLKKGDFVIEYVGEMIDEEEYKKRLAHMHENNEENFYFLTIDKDRMLDAGPKGNVARFMNHSCQPNCETQKWTVNGDTRVGLFAVCDIPANTELVFNYNLESIGTDKKPCMCGAPNCSGFIGVKANKTQDKEESKEKKVVKKKKSLAVSKAHDEDCFVCGEGGELLLCDGKHCTKGYHLSCLSKKQRPQGYWLCPWHQCNVCNKGRVQRCTFCVNSFCQEHLDGNIRLDPVKGLVCSKHDQDKAASSADSTTPADEASVKDLPNPAPTPMDVDEETSGNSNTSQTCENSENKVEAINNNIIKPTPERRTRRSHSYTGSKPSGDTVHNGVVEKAVKRRGRPSSVDDKLIVSYIKTEQVGKPSPKQGEAEAVSNSHNDVEDLQEQVLNTVIEDNKKALETIGEEETGNEDTVKQVEQVSKTEENISPSAQEVCDSEKEGDLVNQSLETEGSNKEESKGMEEENGVKKMVTEENKDKNHVETEEITDDPIELEDTIEAFTVSKFKDLGSDNVIESTSCEDVINDCVQIKKPKTDNETFKNSKHKEITKLDDVLIQNGELKELSELQTGKETIDNEDAIVTPSVIDDLEPTGKQIKDSETLSYIENIEKSIEDESTNKDNKTGVEDVSENCYNKKPLQTFEESDENPKKESETLPEVAENGINDKGVAANTSTKILDTDNHIDDDFELSYSECSNDKLYKPVNSSESSIEMKLTDCVSTENESITAIEEINSKSELSSCIEQSSAMEVA